MSLNAIINIYEERLKKENEIFKTIYKRVEDLVIFNVNIGSNSCIYTIPEFVWGYPLIDIPRTMEYLLDELFKKGFMTFQIDSKNIYISWSINNIKNNNKQKSKVILQSNDDDNDTEKETNEIKKTDIFDVITRPKLNRKNKT